MKIRKILFKDRYFHWPVEAPYLPLTPAQWDARLIFSQKLAEGKYTTERVERCLCGNDVVDLLASSDRLIFPQIVLICPECGLIMNSPRLDSRSYNDYYSSGMQNETYKSPRDYLNSAHMSVVNPFPEQILGSLKKIGVAYQNTRDLLSNNLSKVMRKEYYPWRYGDYCYAKKEWKNIDAFYRNQHHSSTSIG